MLTYLFSFKDDCFSEIKFNEVEIFLLKFLLTPTENPDDK